MRVGGAGPLTQAAGIEAIGRGFRRLREHAGSSFGASAVLCLPIAFVSVISALRPGFGITAAGALVSTVVAVLVAYAATLAAGSYAGDLDPGVGGVLRMTFARGMGSYLATRILRWLILTAAALVGLAPFLLTVVTASPDLFGSGQLLLLGSSLVLSLPLAIFLYLIVFLQIGLAPFANALDRLPPARSIRRSREVTKGHRGQFLVALLGLIGIRIALSLVLAGPAGMVSTGASPGEGLPENPFSEEFLRALLVPAPLNPAQALVVGLSTYLSALVVTVVWAAVLAEFYMSLSGAPRGVETPEPAPAPPPAAEGSPGPPEEDAGGPPDSSHQSLQPPEHPS